MRIKHVQELSSMSLVLHSPELACLSAPPIQSQLARPSSLYYYETMDSGR
jgi:hypothetical protein